MKETKRFLSLILCLVMAVGIVPAFTAEAAADSTSYVLTLDKGDNGTASVAGTTTIASTTKVLAATVTGSAVSGTEYTVSFTPYSGYELDKISVYKTGNTSSTVAISGNKFTQPAYDVTVKVTFKKISGDTSWYSDSSTQFTLTDSEDLKGFVYLVNTQGKTFQGKTVTLGSSFPTNTTLTEAIGYDSTHYFQGTFNGSGKIIKLSITNATTYAGLFGNIHGGIVINVGVTGTVTGLELAGGIVGNAQNAYICNSFSQATATATNKNGNSGSLVGYNNSSSFVNCYATDSKLCGYGSVDGDYVYAVGYNDMTDAYMKLKEGDNALVTKLNDYATQTSGLNNTKSSKAYQGIYLLQWSITSTTYPTLTSGTTGLVGSVKHTITVEAGANCKSASTTVSRAVAGTTINISVTPKNGYYFNEIVVYKADDVDTNTTYYEQSFTMPDYDVEVTVVCGTYQLSKLSAVSAIKKYNTSTLNKKSFSDYLYGGSQTKTNSVTSGITSSSSNTKTSSTSSTTSTTSTARGTVIANKMKKVTKYTVPSKYVDVAATDYFAQPVAWATAKKIADGIDSTHFGPNVPTTRAEMITFIWKAEGSPEPGAKYSGFYDVATSAAYNKAVIWAIENGITDGTSGTTFSPNATVTRAQAVTFLARVNGVTSTTKKSSHSFKDVPTNSYYNNSVAWAYDNYITDGTSALYFSPNQICTRAEIITFIYRAYNFL